MTPQEIAWLEEQQRLEVRLGTAKQEQEAWTVHHGRVTDELGAARDRATALEGLLAEHEKARPEPEPEEAA
jgi:hypothetical protein